MNVMGDGSGKSSCRYLRHYFIVAASKLELDVFSFGTKILDPKMGYGRKQFRTQDRMFL